MTMEEILSLIPDYTEFKTVEEIDQTIFGLKEKYPEVIEVSVIGTSRGGHPIQCMKMGNGKHNALCYACPHPNEPIGALTMLTLADIFGSKPEVLEETGFTWYLIPCIDPDGTRLNECWFKQELNLENYARGFYRPPGSKQVEWTFPLNIRGLKFDKPIAETRALMKLIDELKPEFTFALHNSPYGGAYWYLTDDNPELCAKLENCALRQNIPLHLGEPEAAYISNYSKAVFSMMSMKAYANYMIKYAGGLPKVATESGGCAADYIETVCDCITMLAEVPYFYDSRINDTSESTMTRREAVLENIRLSRENYAVLGKYWSQVRPFFSKSNPFYEFVDTCIEALDASLKSKDSGAKGPDYERKATVSEVFDNLYGSRVFECLNVALGIRACDYEIAHPENCTVTQLEVLGVCREIFDKELSKMCRWMDENTCTEAIPIRKLVSVQLESALQVAAHITENKGR